jgi:hypothetical protein
MTNTELTDSESDTEINEDVSEYKRSSGATYNDDGGELSSETLSRLASLNNDHHKTGFTLDDSAATTLVEAAMDKDEAKDRHVRFHDHVAESAALVQRMLSMKNGQHHKQDPLGTMMQNRHDSRREEEEIQLDSPHRNNMGGGSVLASLMKLEAKRQDSQIKKKKKKRNSKVCLMV